MIAQWCSAGDKIACATNAEGTIGADPFHGQMD
jgi:hypothetical protein